MAKEQVSIYTTGLFKHLEEPKLITRPGKTSITRSTITIVTADEQKVFLEVREDMIEGLKDLNLKKGEKISYSFIMLGSEKNDKKYNNLILTGLTRA